MSTAKPHSELIEALARCRQSFFAAIVFSLFINLLQLTPSLYMLQVYDRVLSSRSEFTLTMLTLITGGMILVMSLLELVRARVLIRTGARFDSLLNTRVFGAMVELCLRSRSGQQNAQALSDLNTLRQFLTGNGLFGFFDAPWIPIYLLICFLFHPWLGWAVTVSIVVLSLLAILNELATGAAMKAANTEAIAAGAFVNANMRNVEIMEAMGMTGPIMTRWLDKQNRVLALQALASDRAANIVGVTKFLRVFLQSFLLGLGAFLVLQQELTAGSMIAVSILGGRAMAPVDVLIGSWKGFTAARMAYRRLEELLNKVPAKSRNLRLPSPTGRLALEGVSVSPPGTTSMVLRGIGLNVAAGDSVGIIGPSASGKSSLARVVLGLWPAQVGKVRIDGADVQTWNRDELGPWIGYLPQDIELFDGSIAENIARFGEVNDDKVVAAARMAGVHEMILRLPRGYNSVIGEAGSVLSGGQRQRIGLARALYGDPVLVVLDEPNSNLDDIGEAALVQALRELKLKKATVLIITHRPSVLAHVDYILVMNEGQVQTFGSRDQILTQFTRPASVASGSAIQRV
ncbi:MAG: type I secretion system permease/ATPase [Bacteroidetes bacterium]|nr:type I secretion system permease/ATPase [Bacteroidota bacterium]